MLLTQPSQRGNWVPTLHRVSGGNQGIGLSQDDQEA